ncbi:MAG: tetratricopeptide repeat protein, partial [Urechidicola sp.]
MKKRFTPTDVKTITKKTLCFSIVFISFIWLNSISAQTLQPENKISLKSLNNWIESHLEIPEDSIEVFHKMHQLRYLSFTENNDTWKAKSYRQLAQYFMRYAPLDSTLYYLNSAKEIYVENNNQLELAETYLELKGYHNLKAAYSKSMENVNAALEIYEEDGNQQGIAKCYTHLCDLLYYENQYSDAINYCDKAIEIQEQLNESKDLATSYFYKASSQLFSGDDLEDALSTINKSMNLYKEIGENGQLLIASRNTKGNIVKYMERYDDAIATYQENYEESKRLKSDRYLSSSIANIGHVYVIQGKYRQAIPYNLMAIELMKSTGKIRNLWENYMHISNSYEEIGDYKNSLK